MLQMPGTQGQGFPSWGRTQIRTPLTRCARPGVIGLKFALLSLALQCFIAVLHSSITERGYLPIASGILGKGNRDSQLSICLESQKTFQILNSIGTVRAMGTLLFYLLVL